MAVKNKLYKHHKNKVLLAIRNFSFFMSLIIAFVGLAAIPTYIQSNSSSQTSAESPSQIAKSDYQGEETSEDELLTIIED